MTIGPWKLALDIGAQSIGFAIYALDEKGEPCRLVRAHSHVFPSNADNTTAAADRRLKRQQRRMLERQKRRMRHIDRHLRRMGLMPDAADTAAVSASKAHDPYAMRALGLDGPLEPHQYGRALHHLFKRRGYAARIGAVTAEDNAKTDDDPGKIDEGIRRLEDAMEASGARTVGEHLHRLRQDRDADHRTPGVRIRPVPMMRNVKLSKDEKARQKAGATVTVRQRLENGYERYASRAQSEAEFEALWTAQAPYHPHLTDDDRAILKRIAYWQRDLKPVKAGQCRYRTGERLHRALPLAQAHALETRLANLEIVGPYGDKRRLYPEEQSALREHLNTRTAASLAGLRKVLGLKSDQELKGVPGKDKKSPEMPGHKTNAVLADEKRWGPGWYEIDEAVQERIVSAILGVKNAHEREALITNLVNSHGLSRLAAEAVAGAPIDRMRARLGRPAMERQLAALQTPLGDGTLPNTYQSLVHAGLLDEDEGRDGIDELPYYGAVLEDHVLPGSNEPTDHPERRYGAIPNPTVHIALGQLRRIVNGLIRQHGKPHSIALQIARDLTLNVQQKTTIAEDQKKREKANALYATRIADAGFLATTSNIERAKLFDELCAKPKNNAGQSSGQIVVATCPYSGKTFTFAQALGKDVEEDHILPYALTLDNSLANRTLSLASANALKAKRAPAEAVADFAAEYGENGTLKAMQARAKNLPANKSWRFGAQAVERARKGEFLDRHLNDTQYAGRVAQAYLETLYDRKGANSGRVLTTSGRMTAILRRALKLDALFAELSRSEEMADTPATLFDQMDVIAGNGTQNGQTEKPRPKLGMRYAKNRDDLRHHALDAIVVGIVTRRLITIATKQAQALGHGKVLTYLPEPWTGYKNEIREVLEKTEVSWRPDKGSRTKADGTSTTTGALHEETVRGRSKHQDNNAEAAKTGKIAVRQRVLLSSLYDPLAKKFRMERVAKITNTHVRTALEAHLLAYPGKTSDAAEVSQWIAAFSEQREKNPFAGMRHCTINEIVDPKVYVPVGEGLAKRGDNDRIILWQLPDGKHRTTIVSVWDAHRPGHDPRPRNPDGTVIEARKTLALRKGEIVDVRQGKNAGRWRVITVREDGVIGLGHTKQPKSKPRYATLTTLAGNIVKTQITETGVMR